jgi:AcrR family transcriptional regulator
MLERSVASPKTVIVHRKRARQPRIRRTAEEARQAILDAAEKRLIVSGPAGIRLQDVARDVGVSHPTVLHHFGNREGLIVEVVNRAFGTLHTDLVEAIASRPAEQRGVADLLERVFDALANKGHARVLAWMALENIHPLDQRINLEALVAVSHEARLARCREAGTPEPTKEDTAFTVLLAAFSLFGQSVRGSPMFTSAGFPDAGPRFREWLSELLVQHLLQGTLLIPPTAS